MAIRNASQAGSKRDPAESGSKNRFRREKSPERPSGLGSAPDHREGRKKRKTGFGAETESEWIVLGEGKGQLGEGAATKLQIGKLSRSSKASFIHERKKTEAGPLWCASGKKVRHSRHPARIPPLGGGRSKAFSKVLFPLETLWPKRPFFLSLCSKSSLNAIWELSLSSLRKRRVIFSPPKTEWEKIKLLLLKPLQGPTLRLRGLSHPRGSPPFGERSESVTLKGTTV